MQNTVLKQLAFTVLILSCAVPMAAQHQRQTKFRILSVDNMNVISAEECEGVKFIRVLVPRQASEESLDHISKTISSNYGNEFDLRVLYFTSREAAKKFFDAMSEEKDGRWLLAIRGIYSRTKGGSVDKLLFLPSGLTELPLAEFEPREN